MQPDVHPPAGVQSIQSRKPNSFKAVFERYKMILPPSFDSMTQQGGTYVFDGPRTIFSHR